MTDAEMIGAAVQRLLVAYERLGIARRRNLGLNANEEHALLLVGAGTTAPSDLSRTIGMTTAGVTNMLDRLERDGLVRREPHATDKRRVLLTLTKKGFLAQLDLEAVNAKVGDLALHGGTPDGTLRFLLDAAALVERQASDRAGAR